MILYFTAVVRGAGLGKIRHITAVGKDYLLGREQCDAFACSKQPKQAHKNVRVLARPFLYVTDEDIYVTYGGILLLTASSLKKLECFHGMASSFQLMLPEQSW